MKKATVCLLICLMLCGLMTGCSSEGGVSTSRIVCPNCSGSGWQQIMNGTDPITGIPNWISVGCGGCGGSGYIG